MEVEEIMKEEKISPIEKMFDECSVYEMLSYDFLDYVSKGKLKENKVKKTDSTTFYKPIFNKKDGTFEERPEEVRTRNFKFGGSDIPVKKIVEYVKDGEESAIEYINYVVDNILDTEVEYLHSVLFKRLPMDIHGIESAHYVQIRGTWNKDALKGRTLRALIEDHVDKIEKEMSEPPF